MDRGDALHDKEGGGRHAGSLEDGEVEVTTAFDLSGGVADILALRLWGPPNQDEERMTGPAMPKGQAEVAKPERDPPSVSPSLFSLPSLSYSSSHHADVSSSSTSSSGLSLSPPLPPSVELSAVLTDTRLILDVYQGGASALPLLWESIPGQLMGLQYLRLGSEDKVGLDGALHVLPHLTELRSLAFRGTFFISFM